VIGNHDRYSCLVCNTLEVSNLTSQQLKSHVRTVHDLKIEEYCYKYVDKLSTWPRCQNPNCVGNDGLPKKVRFYRLAQIKLSGSSFYSFCSVSCNMFVRHSKKEFRDLNVNRFIKYSLLAAEKHQEYKRSHGTRSLVEDLFWSNSRVQSMKPIYDDRRFWFGRKGGYAMDFSFPNFKLCIELDGWSHNNSKEYDETRDTYLLEKYGWTTLRFKNEEVEHDINGVVDRIIEKMVDITLKD